MARISGVHLQDNSITNEKLALNTIDSEQIVTDAITTEHIIDQTLIEDDFSEGAFTTEKFSTGSVTSSSFASGAITSSNLSEGISLTNEYFQDGSIQWDDFVPPPEDYIPGDVFNDLDHLTLKKGALMPQNLPRDLLPVMI